MNAKHFIRDDILKTMMGVYQNLLRILRGVVPLPQGFNIFTPSLARPLKGSGADPPIPLAASLRRPLPHLGKGKISEIWVFRAAKLPETPKFPVSTPLFSPFSGREGGEGGMRGVTCPPLNPSRGKGKTPPPIETLPLPRSSSSLPDPPPACSPCCRVCWEKMVM